MFIPKGDILMTLKEIQLIRSEIGEDKAMHITCDNEHHFYDNVQGSTPIIWDDENERLISIIPNTEQYGQEKLPIKVVYTSYEHIQFIEAIIPMKDAINVLNTFKDKMTEDEYKYCLGMFSTAANHMCIPSHK